MNENPICKDCKYSRKFPAPYAILCDFKGIRNIKMRYEDILECDKREAKK